MRAKPKTGIFRYATSLADHLPDFCPVFEVVTWKDSFSSCQDKRISPLNAILRLLYELFILPFVLKKNNAVIFHCTINFGVPFSDFRKTPKGRLKLMAVPPDTGNRRKIIMVYGT